MKKNNNQYIRNITSKLGGKMYGVHMKDKVYDPAQRPIRLAIISSSHSMKRPAKFVLPTGWDASPSEGYPWH